MIGLTHPIQLSFLQELHQGVSMGLCPSFYYAITQEDFLGGALGGGGE